MVLLILIPMKNGHFIGNIPYFQTNPYGETSAKIGCIMDDQSSSGVDITHRMRACSPMSHWNRKTPEMNDSIFGFGKIPNLYNSFKQTVNSSLKHHCPSVCRHCSPSTTSSFKDWRTLSTTSCAKDRVETCRNNHGTKWRFTHHCQANCQDVYDVSLRNTKWKPANIYSVSLSSKVS